MKMKLTDSEVKHLVEVPKLALLELEIQNDPGKGFQYLLEHHRHSWHSKLASHLDGGRSHCC